MGGRAHELDKFREKIDRELRSGLVSLLLLLVIDRTGPDYGYRILRRIDETSGGELAFKEGTAYPLLANLEKRKLVTSYWGESESGPPRKYYRITALGKAALKRSLTDWRALTANVERIIENLDHDEEE